MSSDHRVPVSKRGDHGWTLCCGGAVKYMDDGTGYEELSCKGCYQAVTGFHLPGLDLVLQSFWKIQDRGPEDIEAAIEAQNRLLKLAVSNEARRTT